MSKNAASGKKSNSEGKFWPQREVLKEKKEILAHQPHYLSIPQNTFAKGSVVKFCHSSPEGIEDNQSQLWVSRVNHKRRFIMLRTIEAVIDKQGGVRLLEPVHLSEERRVLVTILEYKPVISVPETALLSEPALAEDWNRPEEDAAWSHLQQVQSS